VALLQLLSARHASQGENNVSLALRDQVNPRQLRQEIYQLIDHIFLLPGAVPGKTEGVYKTLSTPIESQEGEGIPVTFSLDWTRPEQLWERGTKHGLPALGVAARGAA